MQVALNIAAALALCGCNQVWGLDATQRRDASVVKCPAPGAIGNLIFGRAPRVVIPGGRDAFFYGRDEAGTTAIAFGFEVAGGVLEYGVMEGEVDMDLPKGFAFELPDARPRISPEGDELYARTSAATYSLYTRSGGQWQRGANLQGLSLVDGDILSSPSRRVNGQRRLLVSNPTMLREFMGDGTTWSLVGSYTRADLAPTINFFIEAANLTPDGLALVFHQAQTLVVSVREDLANRFSPIHAIEVAAITPGWAYLTQDCGRIYFSDVTAMGDRGVYYADR